jgi:ABC-type antimicrobial peptide transport system permease subunit
VTLTDYVIDILLIAVVFRQMRARELTPGSVLLPLVLVGVACLNYLKAFTPRGNDLLLIAVLAVAGVALGLLSGIVTDVWRDAEGHVVARAGLLAAAAWVAGMGFRFAFAVWSTGGGAADVTRFSIEHRISSGQAWTTALVVMAVGEVVARVGVLQVRRALAPAGPVRERILTRA